MSSVEPLKARRLYLLLRDRIVSGEERPHDRLPSEPALAEQYGVSRVTVRRALDQLSSDGLIERRPGSGTFVNGSNANFPVTADFANLLSHLVEMGRRTEVKLLSFGYVAPTPVLAEALRLEAGERVQRSVRLRVIDGQPFSYLVTYVPERIGVSYSEADLASTPLLELLERSGLEAERASQTIGATLAGPEIAAALGLEIGSALLSMTRVVYAPSGQGIEHLQAFYRPDLYSFQMDLVRTGIGGERSWTPVERARKGDSKVRSEASTRADVKPHMRRGDTPLRTKA